MINKKVLTILIMSLMFTLLVGCSSVKEYSYDYNKISEISTISLAISDKVLSIIETLVIVSSVLS